MVILEGTAPTVSLLVVQSTKTHRRNKLIIVEHGNFWLQAKKVITFGLSIGCTKLSVENKTLAFNV